MEENLIHLLGKSFISASIMYQRFEKKTHFLQTQKGELLHHTEMTILSDIQEDENICMTQLASKYDVTIGAVSQIVKKLETKGLIQKQKDPLNQSKYLLKLTKEGESLHIKHLKFHQLFDSKLESVVKNMNERDIQMILDFMKDFQSVFKNNR